MRGQRAASNTGMIVAVSAVGVVLLTVIIFVATPGGRRAFRSFLDWAAGKETEEVTEEGPTGGLDPETLNFLESAKRALKAGKLDDAEVAANTVLARAPDNLEAREILLEIAERRRQADQLRRKTIHDDAVRDAGRFLAAAELDRAEEFARKAADAIPESVQAKELLAKITEEKERLEADLARRREQADGLARQGLVALAAEKYERALVFARRALELDERNAAALLLKSQAELEIRRAQSREKQEDSRPAEERRATAQKFYEIARMSWEDGDYEETERFANKALDIWPAHEGARYLFRKAREKRLAAEKEKEKKGPAGPSEAERVVAFLAELDQAIMKEDANALDRLVSPAARGGVITGVAASRTEEIENARGFFKIASDIRIERKTKREDIRATRDLAHALSAFRISYRIGEVAGPAILISRQYLARYALSREAGAWRLRSVTIEDERP